MATPEPPRNQKRVVAIAVIVTLVAAVLVSLQGIRSSVTVESVAWGADPVVVHLAADRLTALLPIPLVAIGGPILAWMVIGLLARSPEIEVGRRARTAGVATAAVIGLVVPGAVYLTEDRTPDAAAVAEGMVNGGGEVGAALRDPTYVPTGPGGRLELVDPIEITYRAGGRVCAVTLSDPLRAQGGALRLSPLCPGG
ncbi:MAG: hypothetical protein ACK5PP_09320 [Acidimicrobiales bacterium]